MPQACQHCHRRKVKCNGWEPDQACHNCQKLRIECLPHERRKPEKRRRTGSPIEEVHDFLQQPRPPTLLSSLESKVVTPRLFATDSPQRFGPFNTPATHDTSDDTREKPAVEQHRLSDLPGSGDRPGSGHDSSELLHPYLDRSNADFDSLRAVKLPNRTSTDTLYSAYQERVMILNQAVTQSDLYALSSSSSPSLLALSVLVAGRVGSLVPSVQSIGSSLYRPVKDSFFKDAEDDALNRVRVAINLSFGCPGAVDSVSTDSCSSWIFTAISLAVQAGLHREPAPDNPTKSARRRLWWTVVARDSLSLATQGRPRAVHLEDSDVRPLTLRDFDRVDENVRLFLAFVELNILFGDITQDLMRGTLGFQKRADYEARLNKFVSSLPADLTLYDPVGKTLRPYHWKIRFLHVLYLTVIVTLYRPPRQAGNRSDPAALLASSLIAGIFEEFLARGDAALLPSLSCFSLLSAALSQIASRHVRHVSAQLENDFTLILQALQEQTRQYDAAKCVLTAVRNAAKTSYNGAPPKTANLRMPPLLSEQRALFAKFGPELSGMWDLFMDDAAMGPLLNASTPSRGGAVAGAHFQPANAAKFNHQASGGENMALKCSESTQDQNFSAMLEDSLNLDGCTTELEDINAPFPGDWIFDEWIF